MAAHKDPEALEKLIDVKTTPDDKYYHAKCGVDIPKGDPPSDKALVDFQKNMRAIGGTELQLGVLKDIEARKFETGKFDRPGDHQPNAAGEKLLKSAVLEPNGDLKVGNLTVRRDNVENFKASVTADRPDTAALVSRIERESKGSAPTIYHQDAAKVPPLDPQVQAILKQIPKETMTTRNYAEYNEKMHQSAVASELRDLNAPNHPISVNGVEKKTGPVRISGTVESIEDKDGVTTITMKDARGNETKLAFNDVADKAHPASTSHPLQTLTQSKPGDKLTVEMDATGMNFATHTERDGRIQEDRRGPHAAQAFGDPVAFDTPVQAKAMAHTR